MGKLKKKIIKYKIENTDSARISIFVKIGILLITFTSIIGLILGSICLCRYINHYGI